MNRKIGIKELHAIASRTKYYDFENWIAKELFNQPTTVDSKDLTDSLFLCSPNKEENLEYKFKKETGLDAYIFNDLRGHIATDTYVEWLEEQVNK